LESVTVADAAETAIFQGALAADAQALERILREGLIERGFARIGAEQEVFLVDASSRAAPVAPTLLDRLDRRCFSSEIGRFNLELNASPRMLEKDGLRSLEAELSELFVVLEREASGLGVLPVMTGMLPTLSLADLDIGNLYPSPRYLALNERMAAARGRPFEVAVEGLERLVAELPSVLFGACNASFQVHLQSTDPDRFAHDYCVSQLLLAPVLAAATNSPLLFGKRLWAETRVPIFEQCCDTRRAVDLARGADPRVSVGKRWATGTALEVFTEMLAEYPPVLTAPAPPDPLAMLDRGELPALGALGLHNSTIYRWNRPCYGVSERKTAHLRIEFRALPSGPTIVDEVANAALWLGLMTELTTTLDDVPSRLEFAHARANFAAVARYGIDAPIVWLDGRTWTARPLLLERLLPLAEAGLARARVDPTDARRYLAVVERRASTERTGSRWLLDAFQTGAPRTVPERLAGLVRALQARQTSGNVVADWEAFREGELAASTAGGDLR
jgi:hypothetical protein